MEQLPDTAVKAAGLFITNEGNFQSSNGSLSYLDFNGDKIFNDVYSTANENKKLGDVVQSCQVINSKLYVVVNNSSKIQVIDPKTFKDVEVISGFVSPRYVQQVSASKAYVTDLYSNCIYVLDLTVSKIVSKIPCKGWTEKMHFAGSKVYVCNLSSPYIYIIDKNTDQLTDSIHTGSFSPNSIGQINDSTLLILCAGNTGISGRLLNYDLNTMSITKAIDLSYDKNPSSLIWNHNENKGYFLYNSTVCSVDTTLSFKSIITGIAYPYSLHVILDKSELFVADVKDFVSNGIIWKYKTNGTYLNKYPGGIIPGSFCLYHE